MYISLMFKKKLYSSNSSRPFRLSRTKIDLFFECKRCFFLDQKFGIKRPHGTPLVLSNRIVEDLKKELNICREKKVFIQKLKNLIRILYQQVTINLRNGKVLLKVFLFFMIQLIY